MIKRDHKYERVKTYIQEGLEVEKERENLKKNKRNLKSLKDKFVFHHNKKIIK